MEDILKEYKSVAVKDIKKWFLAGKVSDFPVDGGACIKYGTKQVAIFYFHRLEKWFACQNLCPHKFEMVLSRGLTGETEGIPKVACPLHKKSFSLEDGKNLNGEEYEIAVYPVKIDSGNVYVGFIE